MTAATPAPAVVLEVRIRGRVQGVGFRPHLWRVARACGVTGDVRNDADGVLVHVCGEGAAVDAFLDQAQRDAPPLARIASIAYAATSLPVRTDAFVILASDAGRARTEIAPDAAMCAACRDEVLDPFQRRYRYPFANCTDCGPRLSIVSRIPYDRANTTTAAFTPSRSRVIAAGRGRG
jgi:hydrogenase maturation protein HypF